MDYLGKRDTPEGERHLYNAWLADVINENVVVLEFALPERDDDHARFIVEQSAIEAHGYELPCSSVRN